MSIFNEPKLDEKLDRLKIVGEKPSERVENNIVRKRKKCQVLMFMDNKAFSLGVYTTLIEARKIKRFAIKYYGEFANINSVENGYVEVIK